LNSELERKGVPLPVDKPSLPENNLFLLEKRKEDITNEIHER
jgi:hypothetical protein